MTKSDPRVGKMKIKWRPRTLLKVVFYGDSVENGPICDLYIICNVFITLASLVFDNSYLTSKSDEKRGAAPRSPNRTQK